MINYFEFVDNLARDQEDKLFLNSGPVHASIVMSRIFKYSTEEVLIFCGGFSGDVSNDPDYLKHLSNFLSKDNTKLEVIVEAYKPENNPALFNILKMNMLKVKLYETDVQVVNPKNGNKVHFSVGDCRMLRLETDITNFHAQVNFNAPDAKTYCDLFNKLKDEVSITREISLAN